MSRGVSVWPVVVAAVLAACEDRYGTYLTVDGDTRAIGFDRVELYFGRASDAMLAQTPSRPILQPSRTFTRAFDSSDVVTIDHNADGSLARETTFYLPVDETNQKLGEYVIVVAYAGDTPVGIGEFGGFKVEADRVFALDVELEPYPTFNIGGQVDRWGDAPGCIAWTRHRPDDAPFMDSTVAVVGRDDNDCDGLDRAADCDDRTYCPPGEDCGPEQTCGSGPTCALGCGDLVSCSPRVCFNPGFCTSLCNSPGLTLEQRHACAFDSTIPHMNVQIPAVNGMYCETKIAVSPYGFDCKDPHLEWTQQTAAADTLKFMVSASSGECVIEILQTDPLSSRDERHLVISFAAPDGALRWSFVIGIEPTLNTTMTSCEQASPPIYIDEGAPADCK